MSAFDKLNFVLVGQAPHQAYVRMGRSRRALVFFAGFGQSAESWVDVIREFGHHHVRNDHEHTIAVIVRQQEEEEPSRFIGWQSLKARKHEVVETVLQLKRNELKSLRLTLVGHSLGALLARNCLNNPAINAVTDRIVQVCPSPLTWWDFTFHPKFWWSGGLLAIPYIILALMCVTRGFFPPKAAVRNLFTGRIDKERFESYYWTMVHDSAWLFIQLMFFHNEIREWQNTRKRWSHRGHNVIVATNGDPVISNRSVMRLIQADMANDQLFWFSSGTPHCFWMGSDMDLIRNLVMLRAIIEG